MLIICVHRQLPVLPANVLPLATAALVLQVGDLPIRSIPLRLQVTGSPLVLSKERVLVQGLQQLQHLQQQQPLSPPSPSPPPAATAASSSADGAHHLRANNTATAVDAAAAVADRASIGTVGTGTGLKLALGVVPAGVQYERTFYVVNTGKRGGCRLHKLHDSSQAHLQH